MGGSIPARTRLSIFSFHSPRCCSSTQRVSPGIMLRVSHFLLRSFIAGAPVLGSFLRRLAIFLPLSLDFVHPNRPQYLPILIWSPLSRSLSGSAHFGPQSLLSPETFSSALSQPRRRRQHGQQARISTLPPPTSLRSRWLPGRIVRGPSFSGGCMCWSQLLTGHGRTVRSQVRVGLPPWPFWIDGWWSYLWMLVETATRG